MHLSDLSPWWALAPLALWAVGGFIVEYLLQRRRHNLVRRRIRRLIKGGP